MYDTVIIGAGTAGLTASIYLRRASKKVLVLEAKSYGGQIVNAAKIENYPGIAEVSGFDYATTLYNQVKNLGAEFKFETVIRIEEDKSVVTKANTYKAKAIILATGSENRKLNLPNEDKFIGRGVSYCATCDGNFYRNKTVAVVGGGNTALEDAIYLSNLVEKLYLIHRRNEFRGEEKLVDELKTKENVEIIFNSNVISLNGDKKLDSIVVEDNSGNKKELNVDGLFIAVGREPKNSIFANIIDLDENGYIKYTGDVHTNVSGIYVAGDAKVKELRQLTTAVSDGAIAATTAIREMK